MRQEKHKYLAFKELDTLAIEATIFVDIYLYPLVN